MKPSLDDIERYVESCRKIVAAYDLSQEAIKILERHCDKKFIDSCLWQNNQLIKFYVGNEQPRQRGVRGE